nr:prostate stem cell antigen [Bos taurus]
MKALILPLLAANLALQPGTALQCYSCEDQGNNEGCQRVQNCRTSAGPSVSVSGPCTPGLSASCPAPLRCPSDATPRPRPAHSPGRPAPRVIPRTPSVPAEGLDARACGHGCDQAPALTGLVVLGSTQALEFQSRVRTGGRPQELGQGRWMSAQGPALPSISTAPPPTEGISLLTVISKGCSSHCVEDSGNSFGSKKNIACCSTDLCNASRAQALQPAGVTQVLLGAPGHLLLWGRAQL